MIVACSVSIGGEVMRVLLFVLIFSATLMANRFSQAEFREFTDAEDRTITADLIRYDPEKEMVRLKPKGKSIKMVPIDIFSEKDQDDIKLWQARQDFMDDRSLEINCSRTKEKITGSTSKLRASTNTRGVFHGEIKMYDQGYKIRFENKTSRLMEGLTVEYVLFYAQEEWGLNRYKDKRVVEGMLRNKTSIRVPAKAEQTLLTDTVQLENFRDDGMATSYTSTATGEVITQHRAKLDLDGELEGIILKITMEVEDIGLITRTIRFPDTLDKEWPEEPYESAAETGDEKEESVAEEEPDGVTETGEETKDPFSHKESDSLFSW